jgi:lipid A 3-O-deacylase
VAKFTRIALVLCLLAAAGTAQAVDRVTLSYGHAAANSDHVRVVHLALTSDWKRRWFTDGNWYLTGYWEGLIGHWHSDPGRTGNETLQEIALRPVARLYRYARGDHRVQPYVEFGLGLHLLSDTQIEDKNMSTHFQFGSNIGAGVRFGQDNRFEVGWRFMHLSNADLKEPNPGINFNLIHVGYQF